MEKWKSMYTDTYNFVYLRAKTILKREEDVQQLMKEVYMKAVAENVKDAQLYEWLGRQVYILGCGKFRKKKVREADLIDLDADKYSARETVDREETIEVICDALEDLPDMYHATLYAFYYDCMKVKDIATVMGYSVGAIVNRLNYVHKYLEKALGDYAKENYIQTQFSVEMICEALQHWTDNNQLGEQVAQNIYASICREMGQVTEEREISTGVAGADRRMCKEEAERLQVVSDQLRINSVKKAMDKKQLMLFGGVGALVLLTLIGLLLAGKQPKKDEKKEDKPAVEQQEQVDEEETTNEEEEAETETESETEAEYVLPKSGTEKLTRADLEGLTKEQLYLARNEIYARHGMIFGVQELDQYFATKSWYKPTVTMDAFNDNVEMSMIEEENVMLIQQVERER